MLYRKRSPGHDIRQTLITAKSKN